MSECFHRHDLKPGFSTAGSLLILTETRAGFALSYLIYPVAFPKYNSLVKYVPHKYLHGVREPSLGGCCKELHGAKNKSLELWKFPELGNSLLLLGK